MWLKSLLNNYIFAIIAKQILVTPNYTYALRWADHTQEGEVDFDEFCKYVDRTMRAKIFFSDVALRKYRTQQVKKIAECFGLLFTVEELHKV